MVEAREIEGWGNPLPANETPSMASNVGCVIVGKIIELRMVPTQNGPRPIVDLADVTVVHSEKDDGSYRKIAVWCPYKLKLILDGVSAGTVVRIEEIDRGGARARVFDVRFRGDSAQ